MASHTTQGGPSQPQPVITASGSSKIEKQNVPNRNRRRPNPQKSKKADEDITNSFNVRQEAGTSSAPRQAGFTNANPRPPQPPLDVGRSLAAARNAIRPSTATPGKQTNQTASIHTGPIRPTPIASASRGSRPAPNVQPRNIQIQQNYTGPEEFDAVQANTQLFTLLTSAPSAFLDSEEPFLTAYAQTLMRPDDRESIYPPVLRNVTQFSRECYTSWQHSLPPQDVQETVSRIVWNINEVVASRWPRLRFVVEPFGSVSWRGETGNGGGDIDLVLRDYARPLGYTEEYWGEGGLSNMKVPSVYNTNVMARTLRENGYSDVEPIRWASTPIVKFKDPHSDFAIDLNINDLGGLYNSAMINAYCRLSPFQLRPLIHIVKSWSKARDLNDPSGKDGATSLSSYCWALLAIAYMQEKHALPNLQDEDLVTRNGRNGVKVWVGWGRRQGTSADISFVDKLEDEDFKRLELDPVEWDGEKFLHSENQLGDLVKGFFEFYYQLTKNSEKENNATLCLSVWKGGVIPRAAKRDMSYDYKLQQASQKQTGAKLPAAAQQSTGARAGDEKERGPIVRGFAQPHEWVGADLVVQDPFLHDKNCARGMNHHTFTRLQKEFERANMLMSSSGSLEVLLEKSDHKDEKGGRAAKRLSRKEQRDSRAEKQTTAATSSAVSTVTQTEAGSSKQEEKQHQEDSASNTTLTAAITGVALLDIATDCDVQTDGDAGAKENQKEVVDTPQEAPIEVEFAEDTNTKTPRSLGSVDTVYSADSIEWAPSRNDIFVCGTYQIEKLESENKPANEEIAEGSDDDDEADPDTNTSPAIRRKGRALVYQVNNEDDTFKEIQRFDGPAILDMKWSPVGAPGGNRLAISNAEGQISLHQWSDTYMKFQLQQTVQVEEDSSILCLSLDWADQLNPASSNAIITSLSNGNLAHLVTDTDGSFTVEHAWHAHDYEPWITAWDLWQPDTVWSGGDDLKLKRWDVRAPMMPALVNKQFEGGVTTIAFNPHVEHLMAVGSYDENLRLFDARNARIPLSVIPVGGGIWRTKWHPSAERKGDVLLASMHGGFKVITLDKPDQWIERDEATRTWSETASFQEHASIAYGVDWQRGPPSRTKTDSLVASCSFYDHLMHVWRA